MMSIKEHVAHALDSLGEAELKQVAEYVAFLKFRARVKPRSPLDEIQVAALYTEFADEDRRLAEEGISDYAELLCLRVCKSQKGKVDWQATPLSSVISCEFWIRHGYNEGLER